MTTPTRVPGCTESHCLLVSLDGDRLADLAAHLRNHQRHTHLVACTLSKETIETSTDAFFLEMHEALVEFGSLLLESDTSGLCVEIDGSLASLRDKGGYASICAEDLIALSRIAQERASPPRLGASPPSTKEVCGPSDAAFVQEMDEWAQRVGLITTPRDCPGKTSYVRTAYRLFPDQAQARAVAKYMLLVAVGDVLFDTKIEGESEEARALRLEASALYLCDRLSQGHTPRPPPNVAGVEKLVCIADEWQKLLTQAERGAPLMLQKQWKRALCDHYIASVREHDAVVTQNPLLRSLASNPTESTADAIRARYAPRAPAAVATRLLQLLKRILEEPSEPSLSELAVWLYLLDVNTIGAALAFRTAALFMADSDIPNGAIQPFHDALPLLDLRVRLANDMSGFVANLGRDRDEGKTNACALLLPESARGADLAYALMRAKTILRAACQTLDRALDCAIASVEESWPAMGHSLRIGRALGVGAYEMGHYTTLSADEFSALLEANSGFGQSPPCTIADLVGPVHK